MTAGGMDAESSANGLLVNIKTPPRGDSKSARRTSRPKNGYAGIETAYSLSFKCDEQGGGPDLGIVHLAPEEIHRPVAMRSVSRLHLEDAAHLARQRLARQALKREEHLDARELLAQPAVRQQLGAGDPPLEPWAVHKRIALQRISDLDVAVDRPFHADFRRRELRDVDLYRVGVAERVAAKPDLGSALSPAALFEVLEAAALECIDHAAGYGERSLPFGGAVAVLDARAAPAQADSALGVPALLLQIALPEQALMVIGGDEIPAGISQETVVDARSSLVREFVALQMAAAARDTHRALAGRRPGVARAQGRRDGLAVEPVGEQAGDATLGAEHRGARNAAAAATAVLVARGRSAELVAAAHRFRVEPAEVAPRRADLDQSFELRIVPIEDAAAPADMRDEKVAFRVVAIGRPQFFERPGARLDAVRASHVLVPLEGAHMRAVLQERELRRAPVQEDHVMVASRAGAAAPFGARKSDEASVLVDRLDQLDGFVPARLRDVEVVVREGEHVEPGDVAPIREVVARVVRADGVVGVHVQIDVIAPRHVELRVDRDIERRRRDVVMLEQPAGHRELAGPVGRQVVEREHRPALARHGVLLAIHGRAVECG